MPCPKVTLGILKGVSLLGGLGENKKQMDSCKNIHAWHILSLCGICH